MQAALYLRSSKDRSDVSIDAQRRDLERLADAKGLTVIREFADAVESGKNESRPGFQALLQELKSPARAWTHLLMLDTSRLGRRQYLAYIFDHECQRRGITVLYSKLPETDPITDVVIRGVFRAFDEWHSLMSREKGLAGMAENVRKGFRAGGRAPRGYRLQHIETGAIRDGEPVRKSKLVPGPEAALVGRYLKARAEGRSRQSVAMNLGITWAGLVDMEWNALTYAGHTVWNMRRPQDAAGGKRRPRLEWMVQRDTHQALITDAEAEAILAHLEHSPHVMARRGSGTCLLAGLLLTQAGVPWQGDGRKRYRVPLEKGCRTISADAVEKAVLGQIAKDMSSPEFVDAVVRAARERTRVKAESVKPIRDQLQILSRRIARMMDVAAELQDRGPALRRIEELETERVLLEGELRQREHEEAEALEMQRVTAEQVQAMLAGLPLTGDRLVLRDSLDRLLDRIELDPDSGACQMHYRINPFIRGNCGSGSLSRGDAIFARIRRTVPLKAIQRRRRKVA